MNKNNSTGKTMADFLSENKLLVWIFVLTTLFLSISIIYNKWGLKYGEISLIPPVSDSLSNNIIKSPEAVGEKATLNKDNHSNSESTTTRLKKTQSNTIDSASKSSRSIAQTGKNNLYVEGANNGQIQVGDVYYKPAQRHVSSEDLKRIFKYAPDKTTKIKVAANASIESGNFQDEILEALSKNGYINSSPIFISDGFNYFKRERLSIKNNFYGKDSWVEVIVNPQE